jgi:hypothetical protein
MEATFSPKYLCLVKYYTALYPTDMSLRDTYVYTEVNQGRCFSYSVLENDTATTPA